MNLQEVLHSSRTYVARTSDMVQRRRVFLLNHALVDKDLHVAYGDWNHIVSEARVKKFTTSDSAEGLLRLDLGAWKNVRAWCKSPEKRLALIERVIEASSDASLAPIKCFLADIRAGQTSWGEFGLTASDKEEIEKFLLAAKYKVHAPKVNGRKSLKLPLRSNGPPLPAEDKKEFKPVVEPELVNLIDELETMIAGLQKYISMGKLAEGVLATVSKMRALLDPPLETVEVEGNEGTLQEEDVSNVPWQDETTVQKASSQKGTADVRPKRRTARTIRSSSVDEDFQLRRRPFKPELNERSFPIEMNPACWSPRYGDKVTAKHRPRFIRGYAKLDLAEKNALLQGLLNLSTRGSLVPFGGEMKLGCSRKQPDHPDRYHEARWQHGLVLNWHRIGDVVEYLGIVRRGELL